MNHTSGWRFHRDRLVDVARGWIRLLIVAENSKNK